MRQRNESCFTIMRVTNFISEKGGVFSSDRQNDVRKEKKLFFNEQK